MKRYALISGVAYLLIFATGFYANFTVLESLVDRDNMALTVQNFVQFHSKFGLGLLTFLAMLLFDVVLVFSLFPLTQRAHRKLTYVASTLRMLHAIGFAYGLFSLFQIYPITVDVAHSDLERLEHSVKVALQHFDVVWTLALVVFGMHLFVLGYLSIRHRAFPKFIGVLLVLAAVGYVVDGSAKLLLSAYSDYKYIFETLVVFTGILGEFTFTLWLLIKGISGFRKR